MNISYIIENLLWASKILEKEKSLNMSTLLIGTCQVLRNLDNEIKDSKMLIDAKTENLIVTVNNLMKLNNTILEQKELLRAAIYCLEMSNSKDQFEIDIRNELKQKIWKHLDMSLNVDKLQNNKENVT